ncbi:MAG: LamG domain-containing protein [Pseudobacter sp.]|uniref:LamG domain-containing protein n=1 Tax=Pseudobacter sp. TaxID=2045420 RepID=UPI003F7F2C0F
MKILSLLSTGVIILLVFLGTTAPMSSCTKTETIRDTVLIPCNCDEESLKKGLVAYYNFKGGNLNDSSGKGNHITFNNATKATDRFGNADGAYLFNGTDSYMQVPNSVSLNPTVDKGFSIMAVVKMNGFYSGNCNSSQILGKLGGNDYVTGSYALRVSDARFDCSAPIDVNNMVFHAGYGDRNVNNGAGAVAENPRVATNKWYTVVFTYGDGAAKMYVDGVHKYTQAFTPTFTPNSDPLTIGKSLNPQFPYWFNGVMDEIRIYERELCKEEVTLLSELKK